VLSCKEITRLASESLDRPLPLRQHIAVWWHLQLCQLCNRFRRQLLFLRVAVRRHPERLDYSDSPCPPPLSPEARERIKRALTRDE
jgi:hypothetical protein